MANIFQKITSAAGLPISPITRPQRHDGRFDRNSYVRQSHHFGESETGRTELAEAFIKFNGFRVVPNTPTTIGDRRSIYSIASPQLAGLTIPSNRHSHSPPPKDFQSHLVPAQQWKSGDPHTALSFPSPEDNALKFEAVVYGDFAPHSSERKLQFYLWIHSGLFPSDPESNFLYTLEWKSLEGFQSKQRTVRTIQSLRASAGHQLILKGPKVFALATEEGDERDTKLLWIKSIIAEAVAIAFGMRGNQELTDGNHRVGILCAIAYLLGHGLFLTSSIKQEAFVFRLYAAVHAAELYNKGDYHLGADSAWHVPFSSATHFIGQNVRFFECNEAVTQAHMKQFAHIVKAVLPVYIADLNYQFETARKENKWHLIASEDKIAGKRVGLRYKEEPIHSGPEDPHLIAKRFAKNTTELNYRVLNKFPPTWEKHVQSGASM